MENFMEIFRNWEADVISWQYWSWRPQKLSTEFDRVRSASQNGEAEFCSVIDAHRVRLKRLVDLRLDARIRGRVDASDIVQETTIEAFQRVDDYLADPSVPLFVWLRFLAIQKVAQFHRKHLGAQARDASREVSMNRSRPAASAALAAQLIGNFTAASQVAVREETKLQLEKALGSLDEMDREVLSLRHFEQLSQRETANVLGITEKAAGSRYFRALGRLRKLMDREQ